MIYIVCGLFSYLLFYCALLGLRHPCFGRIQRARSGHTHMTCCWIEDYFHGYLHLTSQIWLLDNAGLFKIVYMYMMFIL